MTRSPAARSAGVGSRAAMFSGWNIPYGRTIPVSGSIGPLWIACE